MTALTSWPRAIGRSARRSGALSLPTIATLAIGVGGSAAIFAVFYGVLLRPLPFPDADRLVSLREGHVGSPVRTQVALLSSLTYQNWQTTAKTIERIGLYDNPRMMTLGIESPTRALGLSVSPDFFHVLRVAPLAGRVFLPQDEVTRDAAVVSEGLWKATFSGRPFEVNSRLHVDGRPLTVIGVLPDRSGFPDTDLKLWVLRPPVAVSGGVVNGQPVGSMQVFRAVARLSDGATTAQAEAEGTAAARASVRPVVADLFFGKGGEAVVAVTPLLTEAAAGTAGALRVLFVGGLSLLVVACGCMMNIALGRRLRQQSEVRIKTALGATRANLVREAVAGSSLVAIVGGVVGLGTASWLTKSLLGSATLQLPRFNEVRFDGPVVAFVACGAFLCGLGVFVVEVLAVPYVERSGNLLGRQLGGSPRSRTIRWGTIVLQTAFAMALLVVSALLWRSIGELRKVDAGFTASHVVAAEIVPSASPESQLDRSGRLDRVLRTVRSLPSVGAAGIGNVLPLGESGASLVNLSLPSADGSLQVVQTRFYTVTPGFAEALGLKLLDGRLFLDSDVAHPDRWIMVNTEFVRMFGLEAPVGRQLQRFLGRDGYAEIVGVVKPLLATGLDKEPMPEVYTLGVPTRAATLIARASSEESARTVAADLAEVLRSSSPTVPAGAMRTLPEVLERWLGRHRLAYNVITAMALSAVGLAIVGLYGILGQAVSMRRSELALRSLLGATKRGLAWNVTREGVLASATGVILGSLMGLLATRYLDGLLFQVRPQDPVVYASAASVLVALVLISSLMPAVRASRADIREVAKGDW